jgi:uncharacterized membrane protein
MEEWLIWLTKQSALIIDGMALAIISFGAIEAFVRVVGIMLRPSAPNFDRRSIWLQLARWLVAGLTFQLAADIVETAIAPTWDEIGRLAAIAVIRTFLNFFLDRDVEQIRERQQPMIAGEAAKV